MVMVVGVFVCVGGCYAHLRQLKNCSTGHQLMLTKNPINSHRLSKYCGVIIIYSCVTNT